MKPLAPIPRVRVLLSHAKLTPFSNLWYHRTAILSRVAEFNRTAEQFNAGQLNSPYLQHARERVQILTDIGKFNETLANYIRLGAAQVEYHANGEVWIKRVA